MSMRELLADAYMKEEARNGEIMDVWQREKQEMYKFATYWYLYSKLRMKEREQERKTAEFGCTLGSQ